MSFTLMTGVDVDVAPVVFGRAAEGGPSRAAAVSITKAPIVTEYPAVQDKTRLRLFIALMSDTQRLALETSLKTAGARTVNTGGESPLCIPGDYSEQRIIPVPGLDDYPDRDSNGSVPLPAWQRQWQAELTFYRLS